MATAPFFDAIYVLAHAQEHFLNEGIVLRHVCDWAMVQSHNMVKSQNKAGLNNVLYVPNSKPIYDIPIEQHKGKTRFVFLSRILPEKGIGLIFGCVRRLNAEGLTERFDIDFYGMIGEQYHSFEESVKEYPNVTYRGGTGFDQRSRLSPISDLRCDAVPNLL